MHRLLVAAIAAALTACAATSAVPLKKDVNAAGAATGAPAAVGTAVAPAAPVLKSGLDLAGFDTPGAAAG